MLLTTLVLSQNPQPHSGGPDAANASMIIIDFHKVEPGKVFKEMVEDLQIELRTGGVMTNAFRPKRK